MSETNKKQILITDYLWPNLEVEKSILPTTDFDIIEAPNSSESTLLDLAPGCDAIMTCFAEVTESIITAANDSLKIISRYGIGTDNIAVHTASRFGIPVTNVPDYCQPEVADHTLALILNLARGVNQSFSSLHSGEFGISSVQPLWRIAGSTLGLIGLGRIGRAVANRAKAFDLKIVACDPNINHHKHLDELEQIDMVTLDDLLENSDFVSLHLPLTADTRYMLGKNEFRSMKKTAFVINTSRGPLIEESALIEAIKTKDIAGAGLDVYEEEPLPVDSGLRKLPQVLLTSHTAFYSEDSLIELQKRTANCVRLALTGKTPHNVVNADKISSHVTGEDW
tara:strand:- start:2867 stop:3880 length:1014 start_codon:yes stop_codon:yes gene_type:complete